MARECELATLKAIAQALNQAVDVQNAMQVSLEKLLEAMGSRRLMRSNLEKMRF